MPPIGLNAQYLSNDALIKWLVESFPYRVQLWDWFPFHPVGGHQVRYANTGVLTPAVSIGPDDQIPEDTKQPIEPNRVFPMAELATECEITFLAQDIYSSNVNDQVSVQMALAVRELQYKFWTLFEVGDSSANPTEFDGLHKLVDPGNGLDLRCAPLTMEVMDQAIDLIRADNGWSVMACTTGFGLRAILASMYRYGITPQWVAWRTSTPNGGAKTKYVLNYNGVLVWINDLHQAFECDGNQTGRLVPTDQRVNLDGFNPLIATNIWFFVVGLWYLHGIMPEQARSIIVRSTIDRARSSLIYFLTMPVGLALGCNSALSVIKNATIPKPV